MKFLLLAGTAATLIATPALAQDEQRGDTPPDAIIVTGEGLSDTPATPAYSVVEIEREQVVSSASGRLEDVLTNVAGFQQFRRSDSRSSNPSAQGASLRALGGNASSRALILLDGVPLSDPFFGYIPFSAVAPETLSDIRVTRGGGSGPFGAGALAGTIELNSAGAGELGLLSASALANTRGDTELSAILAPEIGEGFAVISGRWDQGDGFFTTPEADRVPASVRAAYESWSVGARFVQPVGEDMELQVRGLAFNDERVLRFAGADNSSEGQDVSLRLVGRGDWQFDVLGYAQWRNFTNVVVSSTRFVPVLDQKDTPSTGLGGKIELRPPVGENHTLRIGADYRRSDGDLFEDAYSAFTGARTEERFAGGTNTTFGLFVEDDYELGALTLTGGVRLDRYLIQDGYYRAINGAGTVLTDDSYADRSGWEFSWRGGALYDVSSALTLRAAAYSGFRLPTLNELYRPFVVFPVTTQANAALEPERLEGWELGIDLTPAPGLAFALTYFVNRVEGAIANVTIAPNLRQRQNLDAVEARGLEFSAAMDLGGFRLNGSVALTDAEQVGSGPAGVLTGNRPAQVPRYAASVTAAYDFAPGASIAATLRMVGDQFEGDQETDVLPAATTLDLFGQVPLIGGLSAVARVENAFDEVIITRNQAGSMDLGAPRTLWLGLRYGY